MSSRELRERMEHDPLVDTLNWFKESWTKHHNKIYFIVIPLIIVFVGFRLYMSRKTEHVEEALSILLRGQEPAYLTIWENLTLHQRKTLRAAALLQGRLITSKEAVQRFQLESSSNATKSLRALFTKGILRREKGVYVFEDVLFCRWIERIDR